MKKLRVLLCMLSLVSLGALTACDDDDDDGRGGGGRGTNDVVAPASLSGKTANVTINSGTPPFAESGSYSIVFADETSYTISDSEGATVSSGSYEYFRDENANTATLVLQDDALGELVSNLTFDTATSGSMETSDSTGGTESSTFTLQ
jgi:hypothetical protein